MALGGLFGEFAAKLDAKGRFLLPAALVRQLPNTQDESAFVLNRGLDKCLVLFPAAVWQQELQAVFATNQFVAENRAFARLFQSGATPVEMDGQGRLLIPKRLADAVDIKQDLAIIGAWDRVEIWATEVYNAWYETEGRRLQPLAEKVMATRKYNPSNPADGGPVS